VINKGVDFVEKELQVIEQFYNLIMDRFRESILEIRLFGSKVRGNSDFESDIDILRVLLKKLANIY